MSEEPRIQQFKKMAEADPENELGHFSLGKAYLAAGCFKDAIAPLQRVLELNPKMSKAYQLLGEAYANATERGKAIDVMTRGVTVADGLGDLMPRDAMARLLAELGAPVPAFKEKGRPPVGDAIASSHAGFRCSRCSRPNAQLEKPPFKGPLGERIFENVCATCWREWIAMGTKVINELGLILSTRQGQDAYDRHMIEFLQLEEP